MKNILENILENILQKIYLSKIKFGFLVRLIWKMTPPRPLMYLLLIERYKKVSEKNLKKKLGKIQKWLHSLHGKYQIIHKINFKSSLCIFQIHGSANKNYTYERNKKNFY